MNADEYRVEVDLGGEGHGLSLGDTLHAMDLDDDARERLGSAVVVTRDGPHLFLYANSSESAREAERVVRDLLSAEELPAEVRVTRWHPVAQEWVDAGEPLPEDPNEIAEEVREREANSEPDDDPRPEAPSFVFLGAYKPRFLRDLGL